MSDEADTKICTNCKLKILSSNYTIHSVHCQRNFFLCSQCEQPVNYNNKVEHDKTNHVIVHCNNCQLTLERYLLDDHLINNCPHRKVRCQICDIEVKATDIFEHENYCGSRTEKCAECGEFVMLKYKSLHIDSNHGFIKLSDEPGPSPSWQYGRRTLCNFMPDLSTKPLKPATVRKRKSNENSRRLRNSGSSESKDDSDDFNRKNFDILSPDKNDESEFKVWNDTKEVKKTANKDIEEWPALSSLKSLQISEDKDANAARSTNISRNDVDEESDLMYAIQVSQEINSDIWRKDNSGEDEALINSFKPLVQNESSGEKLVEKNMFEKNPKKANERPAGDILENNYNYLYDKHESVKLPCEFCGKLIVSNDLILHQSRCSLFMSESYTRRSGRHKPFYFDDDLEKKIACGMCNKFFKMSVLENHQLHCQRNPIKSFKNQDKMNCSKNLKAMNMKCEQGLQNGLEPSSPQLTRMGTRSEWLSELAKSDEGGKDVRNNLNRSESGVVTKATTTTTTTKVSRKNRRAPSPPKM